MNTSAEDAEGDRTWREAQARRDDVEKVNQRLKGDIQSRRELGASHNTCYTGLMPDRTMSDEHKAAIAAGRIEAAAVRDYLDALEAHRPKRGRQVAPEKLTARRADIDSELAAGGMKPIKRLELMQDRRDLDERLADLQAEPDMTGAEAGFTAHAAAYGGRKGIAYATWREVGVPSELLARAGITRGQ